jgi:hypothetical protein
MPAVGIEAGCGLIEDQQLRVVDERPRKKEPPLHSAREVPDLHSCFSLELDKPEQVLRRERGSSLRDVEVPRIDDEVLEDREVGVEVVILGHDAYA